MNTSLLRLAATSAIAAACLSACGGGGGGGATATAGQTVAAPTTTPTTTPTTPTTTPTAPTTTPTSPTTPTNDPTTPVTDPGTPVTNPSTPVTNPGTPTVLFGTAAVSIAGDAGCGYDSVNLTVTKLRFHMDANATDSSTGWTELPLSQPKRINTAQLRNGATMALGTAALLPGHYAQARLVIDSNSSGGTTNSVVASGTSAELPLITQSAAPGGVLFNESFDIANGQALNLVVNVDSCRSIVPNNDQVLLRPVLTPVPVVKNGISGFVATSLLGSNVLVTLQQNGVVLRSTLADAVTGEFNLARMPLGKYDVVISADNAAAAVISGVTVGATSGFVALNSALDPIVLDASSTGTINASLSLEPVSAVEAPFGSALQSFENGPLVTVRARMSNLANGKVRFTMLPLARPILANWQSGQPLTWNRGVAITPGLGIYTIAASAPGYVTTKTLPFTATN